MAQLKGWLKDESYKHYVQSGLKGREDLLVLTLEPPELFSW